VSEPRHDDLCVTCGDVAEPMVVLRLDAARGLALCEAEGGGHRTVETALVAPVAIGDRLLVHAGTAIANTPDERRHPGTPGREAEEVPG